MKIVALFLFSIAFCKGSSSQIVGKNYDSRKTTKSLNNKIVVIQVLYGAIECECAQWVLTHQSAKKSKDNEYIYLEPANNNLKDANKLWDGEHIPLILRLTGKFYEQKGYPLNYKPLKGDPKPARVFRYEKIEIISN